MVRQLFESIPVHKAEQRRVAPLLPGRVTFGLPEVSLLGLRLHAITEQECTACVMRALVRGQGGWVVTPNLDHLRQWMRSQRYAATIMRADLRVADGMPLKWASRLQGTPLPERVSGSNLIYSLSRAAAEHGMRIYLLGGAPRTAERAAAALQRLYPGLKVAGTAAPPPGFEQIPGAVEHIAEELELADPDIVFVALGAPRQEYLIRVLRRHLPTAWWIGVGISFSFVCGAVRRAPRWMQRCGLEWLHRLFQEPGRLWKRYLIQGLPFSGRLILRAVATRYRIKRYSRLVSMYTRYAEVLPS